MSSSLIYLNPSQDKVYYFDYLTIKGNYNKYSSKEYNEIFLWHRAGTLCVF